MEIPGIYERESFQGISFDICLMKYRIWNPESDTLTKWDIKWFCSNRSGGGPQGYRRRTSGGVWGKLGKTEEVTGMEKDTYTGVGLETGEAMVIVMAMNTDMDMEIETAT